MGWREECSHITVEHTMNVERNNRTGLCDEYERLLEASHRAMRTWNEQRMIICESGARGRTVDLQLLTEQAKYAKAQTQLQKHIRECVRCQFASAMTERVQAEEARVESLTQG